MLLSTRISSFPRWTSTGWFGLVNPCKDIVTTRRASGIYTTDINPPSVTRKRNLPLSDQDIDARGESREKLLRMV